MVVTWWDGDGDGHISGMVMVWPHGGMMMVVVTW